MNVQLLIDQVVRQTTVLVAQLATAGGARAPLAHVANRVFVDLADELAAQGVGRKVGADMFGMALRAYVRKVRRLKESATDGGQTLWQAVLDHVSAQGPITRRTVLERFAHDDDAQVRAILRDLTDAGLVACEGSGDDARFRATTPSERGVTGGSEEGFEELVWGTIYREGPLDEARLAALVPREPERLAHAVDRLVADGRVERLERGRLAAHDFTIPLGGQKGWEAAVLDHVQAVVQTIGQRLSGGPAGARRDDTVGGSTYAFDVWPGHPLEAEVRTCLTRLRDAHTRLRERVDAHNRVHGRPPRYDRVVFYGGQCVLPQGDGGEVDDAR